MSSLLEILRQQREKAKKKRLQKRDDEDQNSEEDNENWTMQKVEPEKKIEYAATNFASARNNLEALFGRKGGNQLEMVKESKESNESQQDKQSQKKIETKKDQFEGFRKTDFAEMKKQLELNLGPIFGARKEILQQPAKQQDEFSIQFNKKVSEKQQKNNIPLPPPPLSSNIPSSCLPPLPPCLPPPPPPPPYWISNTPLSPPTLPTPPPPPIVNDPFKPQPSLSFETPKRRPPTTELPESPNTMARCSPKTKLLSIDLQPASPKKKPQVLLPPRPVIQQSPVKPGKPTFTQLPSIQQMMFPESPIREQRNTSLDCSRKVVQGPLQFGQPMKHGDSRQKRSISVSKVSKQQLNRIYQLHPSSASRVIQQAQQLQPQQMPQYQQTTQIRPQQIQEQQLKSQQIQLFPLPPQQRPPQPTPQQIPCMPPPCPPRTSQAQQLSRAVLPRPLTPLNHNIPKCPVSQLPNQMKLIPNQYQIPVGSRVQSYQGYPQAPQIISPISNIIYSNSPAKKQNRSLERPRIFTQSPQKQITVNQIPIMAPPQKRVMVQMPPQMPKTQQVPTLMAQPILQQQIFQPIQPQQRTCQPHPLKIQPQPQQHPQPQSRPCTPPPTSQSKQALNIGQAPSLTHNTFSRNISAFLKNNFFRNFDPLTALNIKIPLIKNTEYHFPTESQAKKDVDRFLYFGRGATPVTFYEVFVDSEDKGINKDKLEIAKTKLKGYDWKKDEMKLRQIKKIITDNIPLDCVDTFLDFTAVQATLMKMQLILNSYEKMKDWKRHKPLKEKKDKLFQLQAFYKNYSYNEQVAALKQAQKIMQSV